MTEEGMFTERVPVRLSRIQMARLKRMARDQGKSVGAVIRDAIEASIAGAPPSQAPIAAVESGSNDR